MSMKLTIEIAINPGQTYADLGKILTQLVSDEFAPDPNFPRDGEGFCIYGGHGARIGQWIVEATE